MDESALVCSSAMNALKEDYYRIAANLANANVIGYKRRCNSFKQALDEAQSGSGRSGAIEVEANGTDFSPGGVTATGRPLDLAIKGEGFFVLETPNGALYTRNGTFSLNDRRELVTSSGYVASGEAGPIVLPADRTDIHVDRQGRILVDSKEVGRLRMVQFSEKGKLERLGASLFRHSEGARGVPAEESEVIQGFRENSNVQVVKELVDLITVMRQYQTNLTMLNKRDKRGNEIFRVAAG